MNWSSLNQLTLSFCVGLAVLLFVGPADICGQSAGETEWLVLKNGQTIEGQVSLENDRYVVETGSGSRIIISKGNASFVADSIEDVYWDKWSRVNSSDANSHIGLFRWCVKKGLLKQAQQQISLVLKLDDLDRQAETLATMAQELELAIARKQERNRLAKAREIEKLNIRTLPQLPNLAKQGFAAAPSIPIAAIDEEGMPVRTVSKQTKSKTIELVGFEEAVKLGQQQRSKPAWVSNRELDLETRKMPSGTVSFFKRHLQQKLIERCASCHDARSLEMPLSRRSFGQTIPRRMSQQNLHFVMEHVDRGNPLESTFLRKAAEAHGGQETPAVLQDEKFMFDLKKWTIAVSHDPTKWLMDLNASISHEKDSVAPSLDEEPASGQPDETPNEPATSVAPAASTANPYDPAAFNRRGDR